MVAAGKGKRANAPKHDKSVQGNAVAFTPLCCQAEESGEGETSRQRQADHVHGGHQEGGQTHDIYYQVANFKDQKFYAVYDQKMVDTLDETLKAQFDLGMKQGILLRVTLLREPPSSIPCWLTFMLSLPTRPPAWVAMFPL